MMKSLALTVAIAGTAVVATATVQNNIDEILKDTDSTYSTHKEERPVVQAWGLEGGAYNSNGLFGFDYGINLDIGWNYELPLYNQDENLVFRQRLGVWGGGRQWVTFTLFFIRITLYADAWLTRFLIDSFLRMDIVNYSDFCTAGTWFLDVLRFSILYQIDVNECVWGLIGAITDDSQDCEWGTYYINQPLFDWQPVLETSTGGLWQNTCGEPIPDYNAA